MDRSLYCGRWSVAGWAALLGALVLTLWAVRPSAILADEKSHAEGHEALHEAMEDLGAKAKELRRGIKDPAKNVESLALVAAMQKNILVAKLQTPETAKAVAAAERPKFVTEYRLSLISLMREMLKLEEALLKNDNPAAEKQLAVVMQAQKAGHEKFKGE